MPDPTQLPEDSDLVAYLDGELAGEAAASVDDQLAKNPKLRKQAEQYRKTFDLLDHLRRANLRRVGSSTRWLPC
jgi:anti-sigma factor RsiW